jgi:hypothetical protein
MHTQNNIGFFINKAIVPMLKEYHNFTLNISPVDISLVSF